MDSSANIVTESLRFAVIRMTEHKSVGSQGQLNFRNHKYATFTVKYVLLVNVRANFRAVNTHILPKKVTGFPSYLIMTFIQSLLLCPVSLQFSLCQT